MKQHLYHLFCAVLVLSLLAGCGARFQVNGGGATPGPSVTQAASQPTALPQATLPPRPTPLPSATAVPQTALAAQAAQDYFAALEQEDFTAAVKHLSAFSLAVFNLSSGDAAAALQRLKTNGGKWSHLEVLETRPFNDLTMLVHVRYQYASMDPKSKQVATTSRDELWPLRSESGVWRYNWGNLIDYRTLTTAAQTLSGITILPQRVMRYSDRIQLLMLMQNSTNQPFVFGQTNEILAQFHFGDKVIPAQKNQIILEPLRSTPDVAIDLPGLYDAYPDSVEIRKWMNLNTPAWFTFDLQG